MKLDAAAHEFLCLAADLTLDERVRAQEDKLFEQWWDRWKVTMDAVAAQIEDGADGKTGEEVKALALQALVDKRTGFLEAMDEIHLERSEAIYVLGKREAFEQSTGYKTVAEYDTETEVVKAAPVYSTTLTLADQEAIAALGTQEVFWIGQYYDEDITAAVTGAADEVILTQGLSGIEAGEALAGAVSSLADIPPVNALLPAMGQMRPDLYWSGMATNAATVARNIGRVNTFKRLGVVSIELVNPDDSHTSIQCQLLSGTIMEVEWLHAQTTAVLGQTTPEGIKAVWPWVTPTDVVTSDDGAVVSGNLAGVHMEAGVAASADEARAMAEAGIANPPFHFRCRTIAEVTEEVEEVEISEDWTKT